MLSIPSFVHHEEDSAHEGQDDGGCQDEDADDDPHIEVQHALFQDSSSYCLVFLVKSVFSNPLLGDEGLTKAPFMPSEQRSLLLIKATFYIFSHNHFLPVC